MFLIFKSAVAFFFLFFLHGTSIGNCQQGISYNVLQLARRCVPKHRRTQKLINFKFKNYVYKQKLI